MATKYLLLAGLLIVSTSAKSHRGGPLSPEETRETYPPIEPRNNDSSLSHDDLPISPRLANSLDRIGRASTEITCEKRPTTQKFSDGDVITFTSPRYPNKYGSKANCGWSFKGMTSDTYFTVSCGSFTLQDKKKGKCRDFLNLNGKKFCGGSSNKPSGWDSSSNSLKIRFKSDKKKNYKGFSCTATAYTFVPPTTEEPQNTCGVSCGIPNRSTRIVGGVATEVNEYPWQVAIADIGTDDFQDFFCGGSIINTRWVLSAAHCEISAVSHQVIVGAHEWDNNPPSYARVDIEEVRDHENYNSATFDNDIALVKLAETLDFSAVGLAPVCLPAVGSTEDYVGDKATVTGWGTTQYQSGLYPAQLMEVKVRVVSNRACKKGYGSGSITKNMLCAGVSGGGKDSCQADSGGPLSVEQSGAYTQIGVVSFGRGCGSSRYYGVYARVTRYMDWIRNKLGDNGFCNQS